MDEYIFDLNNIFRNDLLIKSIKSKNARNLLRGLNKKSSASSIKNAIYKIKKNSDYTDYKKSVDYIRTSQLFEENEFGQLFNKKYPIGLLDHIEYSSDEISSMINKNIDHLYLLVGKCYEIVSSIKDLDIKKALFYCNDLIDIGGVSVFLIRTLEYISNRYQLLGEDQINESIEALKIIKNRISSPKKSFIVDVIYQLSNLRVSHLSINKKINELNNDIAYVYVAKSFIKPIPRNIKEFYSTLSSYYMFSLLDSFLYIKLMSLQEIDFIPNCLIKNHKINDLYDKFSSVSYNLSDMYKAVDADTGYLLLRESFLIIEQPNMINFLITQGYYYSYIRDNNVISRYVKKIHSSYFENVKNLNDINSSGKYDIEINYDRFNPNNSGFLERSNALLNLISKIDGFIENSDEELFVQLMSQTRDIGELIQFEHIHNIAENAKNSNLKLVAKCLVFINNNKKIAEYELRSIIQEVCIQEFSGNLTDLLEHFYNISPSVSEHILIMCDVSFITQLFEITKSPDEALKVRADMLNWYGHKTNNDRFKERSKALNVDIQINKVKGTIDDSRIFVDTLKFSQWFQDNMLNKLIVALESINNIDGTIGLVLIDWDTKKNNISSIDVLKENLLSCYQEFCDNKIFGIASYLGRRIRHGTFKGTAISELNNLSRKSEYVHLFSDSKEFKNKYDKWFMEYEKMITSLVNDYLHIKSRTKPLGIITTDIDTPEKKEYANQLVYEVINAYSSSADIITLPQIVMAFLWRLVEIDLRKAKKLLSDKKASYGVFTYTNKVENRDQKKEVSKFMQEVNSVTTSKFSLMSSWFNKPSYAADRTDLNMLFRAVISEVQGSITNFNPSIDSNISDNTIILMAGTYYVIYDALFILISNAATHGKPDGKLIFKVLLESKSLLKFNIVSEVCNKIIFHDAIDRINEALSKSDANAHIVEGNSGIKKLKAMEKDDSISNVAFSFDHNDLTLTFDFDFKIKS